jgi:hypothetical protein
MKRIRQGDTVMLCRDQADRFKHKAYQLARLIAAHEKAADTDQMGNRTPGARHQGPREVSSSPPAGTTSCRHRPRAALLADMPWLDVFCPGCGTSRALDLRAVDRHPLASVGTLVLDFAAETAHGERIPIGGDFSSPRFLGITNYERKTGKAQDHGVWNSDRHPLA